MGFHTLCSHFDGSIGGIEKIKQIFTCKLCFKKVDFTKTKINDFSVILDPSDEFKRLLNKHHRYYDWMVNKRRFTPGLIKDFYDGKKYRDFVRSLPLNKKMSYATLILNTDGAQVFERSQESLWPIYVMISQLPISIRMKNVICCGLWFGQKKPDMSNYLKTFVEFFNENLTKSGIICEIDGQERRIFFYVLVCCVDTDARPTCQSTTRFNGHYGCSWCLHSEKSVTKICYYPILNRKYPARRKLSSTLEAMNKSVEFHQRGKRLNKNQKKILKGIKVKSPMLNLECFDVISGFIPDYLHACLHGVGKRITEKILQSLPPDDILYLSQQNEKIKVPHQLAQTPRSLLTRHLWKAKE